MFVSNKQKSQDWHIITIEQLLFQRISELFIA